MIQVSKFRQSISFPKLDKLNIDRHCSEHGTKQLSVASVTLSLVHTQRFDSVHDTAATPR